ncbi:MULTISPECIES: AAA family ATPase [unclassified Sphingobium]|uniref:AAA family ATPase n=1 Tax=unclassified Sphingobium TaxID=2611147 RepID=UPI002224D693|nr:MULTISPECIES: AAA family ATPase [unclassified Sphingobium]MCW2411586.1 hypothetical protein [Sphingobium sp. B8D3D]MCW2416121.1 hypothetical protein [Sphingobium sp. B8D3A]
MSDENWTVLARRGGYSARDAARNPFAMDWAVEGLLPATGATVLFGTGSTGKTQLLLWLGAHIAAQGVAETKDWLGADVRATGKILVLSAEDLREHLFKRIGGIAWQMGEENGWSGEQVEEVCARIHVMPFLSMSRSEFSELNPSMFERGADGDWQPTSSLVHIEKFLDDANAEAEAANRPQDRFVGVILDSAVSMAGFEMSQSEATTNFLFHLNRMSRRQEMFWAIIGHTPKDAAKKVDEPAVERLRGSAMWSTTPRTVIELRCATSIDNVEQVLVRYPHLEMRDVLFLSTAKANSVGADLRPRALIRLKDNGAFRDVTDQFPNIFERIAKTKSENDRSERLSPTDENQTWLVIIDLVARVSNNGTPGSKFTRQDLRDQFDHHRNLNDALEHVSPEHEGKYSKSTFSLAWCLYQLREFGALGDSKQGFVVIDLQIARSRFSKVSTVATNEFESGSAAVDEQDGSSSEDGGLGDKVELRQQQLVQPS